MPVSVTFSFSQKATTVRTVNMNDIGMGPRGAKYIALMLRENQKITDLVCVKSYARFYYFI